MLNEVLIDATKYKIESTSEKIIVDGQQCSGSIDFNRAKIKLFDEIIGQGSECRILMHEICHGILFERGLKNYYEDETLVDELASGIINLIRANPKLVDFINCTGKETEN